MNDPNGLVYYQGQYHLFYQYNPAGQHLGQHVLGPRRQPDLVHWKELPVAIPRRTPRRVDRGHLLRSAPSSTRTTPAASAPRRTRRMVAIYTSAYTASIRRWPAQAQSLAYSTDGGQTWTKYTATRCWTSAPREFRDPKVFWYAPAKEWRMVVVQAHRAQGRHLRLAQPEELDAPERLRPGRRGRRRLGMPRPVPAGRRRQPAQHQMGDGGQPQPRRHRRRLRRTVLRRRLRRHHLHLRRPRHLHPTHRHRDRRTSRRPASAPGPPPGPPSATARPPATRPAKAGSAGYLGDQLANSFHGGDGSRGTLTSPEFTITKDYLNFLVGGGNHPHVAGTTLDTALRRRARSSPTSRAAPGVPAGPPPATSPTTDPVRAPSATSSRSAATRASKLVNTFIDHDASTGTITSPTFTIDSNYIDLLVGGGNHPYTATGTDADRGQPGRRRQGRQPPPPGRTARPELGGVERRRACRGKQAQIEIVDNNTGGWGHIIVDHIMFSARAGRPGLDRDRRQPAGRRQGRPHRHRPQQRSARLGGWDVRDLAGKTATIQIVDNNTGGWGHILADQFTFADDAGPVGDPAGPLAGLRPRLLRRRHLQQRAEQQADHDRLDEQLAVRRQRSPPTRGAAP